MTAIASVQVGAAVAKRLFAEVGPGGTVLLRLALSALVLVAVARPRLRGRARRDVGVAIAFGLVLAGMNFTFYEAIERIPLGVGVTIEFVGPLAVAVAGSRRRLDLLWAGLAAAGVGLFTTGGSALDLVGVALALLAGAFWGAYILLSRRVGQALPGAQGLAIALCVGALAVLPVGVVQGGAGLVHPGVLAAGFAVAMLSSAVPYSLELSALRRLPTSVFGVLMSLEPAMAALAGLVFLGERLGWREVGAIALVCVASLGATLGARTDGDPVQR